MPEAAVSSPFVDPVLSSGRWAVDPSSKCQWTQLSWTQETIIVERPSLTMVLPVIAASKCNAIVATFLDVQT